MRITRIWADDQGIAHFEELDEPTSMAEYVPSRASARTERRPATDVHVAITPPGDIVPWHPSPRRHLCVTLSGEAEIRVGDGSARRFKAGEMYLGEDRTGQGHETEAVGDADWVHLVVSLAD